jgi:glycosyltransferase involved in cell wall biosynthesis
VIDAIEPDVVVADVVDDNRTWYAPGDARYAQLEQNYRDVLARSDVVLANCAPVASAMAAFADHVDLVANACELPDAARSHAQAAALSGIPRPIIGYAGNLSDRVDLQLLRHLVRAHREWSLVLLGSTHLDRAATSLGDEPNVHLLGTRPYAEAQAIIAGFDVGLIPHVDNAMTRSMNPLKAFVYASLGVPIVASPVANLDEMAEFITIAEGPEAFAAAIDEALTAGRAEPDPARLTPHSWDARVAQVFVRIDEVVSARATPS